MLQQKIIRERHVYIFFLLTLQSYYIKKYTCSYDWRIGAELESHTKSIYLTLNFKTRHITDYKLDNVILILQAFIHFIKHARINTTLLWNYLRGSDLTTTTTSWKPLSTYMQTRSAQGCYGGTYIMEVKSDSSHFTPDFSPYNTYFTI